MSMLYRTHSLHACTLHHYSPRRLIIGTRIMVYRYNLEYIYSRTQPDTEARSFKASPSVALGPILVLAEGAGIPAYLRPL